MKEYDTEERISADDTFLYNASWSQSKTTMLFKFAFISISFFFINTWETRPGYCEMKKHYVSRILLHPY